MAKRTAEDQITRETYGTSEADDESHSAPSKASSAVMSRRKILKPRGHRGNSDISTSAATTPSFSSFKNATIPSSGFSFGSNVASKNTTNGESDKNERIRALNEQFISAIKKAEAPGTIADLTGIASKYINYYKDITGAPKPQVPSAPFGFAGSKTEDSKDAEKMDISAEDSKGQNENEAKSSDSDSEKDEIKIEGPKFTFEAKPAKNLPFSFGPKPAKKKDDSDSESEIEIKGPVFSFNKPIKDSVFKIEPPKQTELTEKPQGAHSGAELSTNAKPAFSFTASSESKPDQSTTASSGGASNKPAFSFGSSIAAPQTANVDQAPSKPAFSFGSSSAAPQAAKADQVPAFSFSAAKDSTTNKPAFGFGAQASTVGLALPFKFNSNQNPVTTSGKSDPQVSSNSDKPSFNFGGTPRTSETTLLSGAGSSNIIPSQSGDKEKTTSNNESKATPFAFGISLTSSGNTPPVFNFSGAKGSLDSASTESKPAFSFGTSNSAPPKPFTFGSSSTPAQTPAFSFGSNNVSNNFGSSNSTGFSKAADDKKDEDNVEEEVGGNFKPIAQLSNTEVEVSTGEEDEEVLFTKRAKLMLFDPNNKEQPYSSKGLGDVRVLKSKLGKTRILMRSEGSSRVLLNTLVSKTMTYTTMGNGSMVRVPVLNNETKAIETFVIKLKLATDGESLQKLLEEVKL